MSVDARTQDKALRLRALLDESVLVLPNAWDAGSAAVIAAAGARAIATTSAGVSWALGLANGRLSRAEMAEAARRVTAAVDVPVTVDVEAGYGPTTQDVAATVHAVIEAGAVGINLEDSTAAGGPLFTVQEQAARIRAARHAATEAGLPELLINARTDVFIFQIGEPETRLDEVLARTAAYAEAGADGIFVPKLLDLAALHRLAESTSLPVNALAGPGGPSVAQLTEAGVRRISLGTGVAQAAYAAARQIALEVLSTGTYTTLDSSHGFNPDGLFSR
ncbi:isocitrate lyase/PEP mutase family protein [Streptomyces aureoverticillatus]|uniref:isocitrate lyase/PEP mutase family protein n=1 Tax=Streptomyces aureoverticillatus TaxID=66871 RepID=UPI0013DCCB03|nr:isocitrate lyase/phosphoenolpyruvate mutase family protein [Streptomyces aureoverticillatus]QIB42865.1 isocitrate lyase/phosphoenolpyruvate mutase family protein [Streptomyces aureoverticillatus]